MDAFTRIKRFKLFEPSIGIIGFFLITAFCVIFSLFYLDYRAVARGFRFSARSDKILWVKIDGSVVEESESRMRVEFMSGGECDVFDGDWVFDERYPLYQSKDCGFMDDGFRCSENGRPDFFYSKWRWQPRDCHLPRLVIEFLHFPGKFVFGWSESLLCFNCLLLFRKFKIRSSSSGVRLLW